MFINHQQTALIYTMLGEVLGLIKCLVFLCAKNLGVL